MSNTKRGYIFITAILCLFAFFAFGCKAKTPVEKISLDLTDFGGQNIVLLVNESYTPKVEVSPSYATNTSYKIKSENENVVVAEGKTIKAVGAGLATIRIVSSDNSKIETIARVTVRSSTTTLASPTNLSYNNKTKTITFSAVANAVGYTLNINNVEIALGNSTQYTLDAFSQYVGETNVYDTNLSIKVRADAPAFGKAYNSSAYSGAKTIYQTKPVENVQIKTEGKVPTLSFSHEKAQNFNLYINGNSNPFKTISSKSVRLDDLPKQYAGQTVQLQIEAVVDEPKDGYYSSFSNPVSVYVLNYAKLSVKNNLISWNAVSAASQYDIYVDESLKTTINSTVLDPATLEIEGQDIHTLRVEPVLSGNNLAKVGNAEENVIQFNFATTPTINFASGKLTWNGDEEQYYSLTLLKGEDVVFGPVVKNDFSFDFNYVSGQTYNFQLVALGSSEGELITFNSLPATKSITMLEFNNYALNFETLPNQNYSILLDDANLADGCGEITGGTFTDGQLTTSSNSVKIDFLNAQFVAGKHNLAIVNAENGNIIFSNFVQLEKITSSISINDSTATILAGDINGAENIKLAIYSKADAQSLLHSNLSNNYQINSTNKQGAEYLPAGKYVIKAFVVGDGSATFSVREGGENLAVAQAEFEVLQAPELSITDYDENPKIGFNSVEGAKEYKLINTADNETKTTTENLYFDFVLLEGSVIFVAQTVGNGSSTLSSCLTDDFKVTRLVVPNLTYNKQEDSFDIEDENTVLHPGAVKNYSITTSDGSGAKDVANIEEFEYEFKGGNNTFIIKANANTELEGEHFLNSATTSLLVAKIDASSTVAVEANNNNNLPAQLPSNRNFYNFLKVKIDGVELANEDYILILKFNIKGTEIEFTFKNGEGKSADERYTLPYVYENGCYYIGILNQDFTPIITEIASLSDGSESNTSFDIYVKFDSNNELTLASEYSNANSIVVLGQSSLSRVEESQQFLIKSIDIGRKESDYELLLDDLYQIRLLEDEGNDYKIDLDYIKQYYEYFYHAKLSSGQHTLKVITKNRELDENVYEGFPTLSKEFSFKLANEVTLKSTKNTTTSGNNSVVVSFDEYETSYTKKYIVKLYTKQETEISEIATLENTKTFNLDDYDFSGTIYVYAYVETTGKDGEIEVFNSPNSNELSFTKVNEVSNLRIVDSVLYFDIDEQAEKLVAFYEVWAATGQSKTLLGTTPSKSFPLSAEFNSTELFVKTISVEKFEQTEGDAPKLVYYSNSNLSEESLVATKITISVDIINGEFVVKTSNLPNLYTEFENGNCYILVKNGQTETILDVNTPGVSFAAADNEIKIICEPYIVLNYSGSESLTFQIKTRNGTSFVNSAIQQVSDVKGLQSLGNLRVVYSQTDLGETADKLTWDNPNPKPDSNYNYVVVLTYNNLVLDSREGVFYYYDSPITISNVGMFVPTSFKYNSSGSIIQIERGKFEIAIKVVPTVDLGAGYASSKYIKTELEILEKPTEISVEDGALVWSPIYNAESYLLKIYTITTGEESEWEYETVETETASFDFEKLSNLNGVLGFKIQAVSSKKNVQEEEILKTQINSLFTDMFITYRLPEVESAVVDDGTLMIKANEYFERAEIEFVNVASKAVLPISYENLGVKKFESTLNWQDLLKNGGLENLTNKEKYKTFYIKVDENEILNLPDNCDYTINVRLIGSSSNENYLPLLSSSKTENVSNLRLTKLKQNELTSSKGEIVFATDQDHNSYNYNLSSPESLDSLVKAGIIYKITLTTSESSNPKYVIYALDYNYFTTVESTIPAENKVSYGDYFDLYAAYILKQGEQNFYIDVYKNNTISFKNRVLRYHKFTATETDSGITYKTEGSEPQSIDLTCSNFEISISILGGDVDNSSAYLTSTAVIKNYYRYQENVPNANNGELVFKDLLPMDGTDVPVYRVLCETADARLQQEFFLYYNNLADAKTITGETDDSKFCKIQHLQDDEQTIYFEISSKLTRTDIAYTISVQTLAGLGQDSNWLDALEPNYRKTFYKLPSRNFVANTDVGLVLATELSYFNSESVDKAYSTRYEVTLTKTTGGEPIVYVIDSSSPGVEIRVVGNTRYLYYTLPEQFSVGEQVIELDLSATYNIKIKPLADNNSISGEKMLNGEYGADGLTVRKQQTISQQKVEDGVLKFKVPDEIANPQVSIKLSFDAGKTITIIRPAITKGEDGYYSYKFNDSAYDVDNSGTKAIIDYGTEYDVKISLNGYYLNGVNIINSDYCTAITATRLQAVSNIYAEDGILTWEAVENANCYEVTVAGRKIRTEQTKLDLTNRDFAAGNLIITIRALSKYENLDSKMLDARDSVAKTFVKLGTASNITMGENTIISWSAVEGANSYHLTLTYGETNKEISVDVPEFDMSEVKGFYTLKIQAVGTLPNQLNGEVVEFESSVARPSPIQDIEWQAEFNRFAITPQSDFYQGDQIEITYYIDGILGSKHELIKHNGSAVYYFYPTIIGKYKNISVVVKRAGGGESTRVSYDGEVDFFIFESGEGTAQNPYTISTPEHFKNISLFPSANFKLTNSIDISSLGRSNGYIIEQFNGVLDGNNLYIYGELTNVSSFTVFKILTGATIKNLTIGNASRTTSITASYSNLSTGAKIALLANSASGATLQNVDVANVTINVQGSMRGEFFLAGLINEAVNTNIEGSHISIRIENFNISSRYSKYVAGMVCKMTAGKIGSYMVGAERKTNIQFNFAMQNEKSDYVSYLGGAVAYAENSAEISNVEASVNLTYANALYCGGVVGYSQNSTISSCQVGGTLSTVPLNPASYNSNYSYNIGGIVGYANSSTINGCTSSITLNIDVQQLNNIFVGLYAGCLEGGSVDFENTQTTLTTGQLTNFGNYGKQTSTQFEN